MNRECIILAGGLGTRLKSVVDNVPKCMAEIAGKPFLHYIFDYLERYQYQHIILALGYKSEIILEWLKTQKRDFNISYVIEEEPLGTGGAIQLAFSKVEGNKAFVLNGDTYFNVDPDVLCTFHKDTNADISLALKAMKEFDRYGSVTVNAQGRIKHFEEKKYLQEGLINGGTYLINKEIFENIPFMPKFSFEKDILENKVDLLNIHGKPFDNYFIDIGIPSDYEKANLDFKNNQI